ncbi:ROTUNDIFOLIA like 6 [Quillaja saponaria]|uniref:ROTUNDIFOLIA like 6 n=1 Tax=Quillaja saponaria TaxID=32244 RepID=A0AAD7PF03_QUISA|nr:ROTUNDIFOLIA like 6 [Quillaja saponaria]
MGQCISRTRKEAKHRGGQQKGCDGSESDSSNNSESSTSGCLATVKELKSRFYIARRCVVMLLFWHKYEFSVPTYGEFLSEAGS